MWILVSLSPSLFYLRLKWSYDGAACGLSNCIRSNAATLKLLFQVDMTSALRRLGLFSQLLFYQKPSEKDTVKERNLSEYDSQLEQFYYH